MLEVASLKRVGKGTKILILDSNGGGAKDIARGLSGRGFRNVFIVQVRCFIYLALHVAL